VNVPSDGFIFDLMDKIKQRTPLDLIGVDTHHLMMWRLETPRKSLELVPILPNLTRLDDVLVEGEGEDRRKRKYSCTSRGFKGVWFLL
jgi:hypothetical protein